MRSVKIAVILVFGLLCTVLAARSTESYAAEAAAKENTLAEAVMRNRLEEQLAQAAEQARQELEEQGETIVTTVMETKPPVTEPPVTTTEETTTTPTTTATTTTTTTTAAVTATETETAVSETTAVTEEETVTEYTRGGILPEDRTGVPVRSMFTLTGEEQEQVINFLVEHYFLDGYKYAEEETRPELKEKKLLAARMEDSVVKSFDLIMDNLSMSDVTSLLTADYGAMVTQAQDIRGGFAEEYADAARYGEQFGALYEDSLRYFDRLIAALGTLEDTAEQYSRSDNPLLAIGLLTNSVSDVVIPEMTAVLEQSFDLVETTQEIYLEGTQGTRLLSRQEVADIIENPGLALYVTEHGG